MTLKLPEGHPSPSSIAVLAAFVVGGYYLWRSTRGVPIGTSFTSADVGNGGAVRPSHGYAGNWPIFGDTNPGDDPVSFSNNVYDPRLMQAHQPVIVQSNRMGHLRSAGRQPWYRFIDRQDYSQQPAFEERHTYP